MNEVPKSVSDSADYVNSWFMQNTARRGWAYKGICDRWYVGQYDMHVNRLREARQKRATAELSLKEAQTERDQAVQAHRELTRKQLMVQLVNEKQKVQDSAEDMKRVKRDCHEWHDKCEELEKKLLQADRDKAAARGLIEGQQGIITGLQDSFDSVSARCKELGEKLQQSDHGAKLRARCEQLEAQLAARPLAFTVSMNAWTVTGTQPKATP
jgi:chromosome segregation ATPase